MTVIGDKNIKELIGEVVSDKTNKTRTVLVKSVKMHPIYKKRFVVSKKYYAHDENNSSKMGDLVKIRECKPLSKSKRWYFIEIIK
ncbi:MAG TPA: 30S ribosomal protein S17 [Candidatus Absconditabacterales bacterium]|nr:30S ribosomal protein S17 [Candidatus Absconditabacterales bacterium]HOQ79088.1 30S ribosomal protein S17 [Candidatus Absconditabacterales bacterium]HPK27631.1 30S ribosomal protein S17 [Candidatus Absconditabacterales bacterium]